MSFFQICAHVKMHHFHITLLRHYVTDQLKPCNVFDTDPEHLNYVKENLIYLTANRQLMIYHILALLTIKTLRLYFVKHLSYFQIFGLTSMTTLPAPLKGCYSPVELHGL